MAAARVRGYEERQQAEAARRTGEAWKVAYAAYVGAAWRAAAHAYAAAQSRDSGSGFTNTIVTVYVGGLAVTAASPAPCVDECTWALVGGAAVGSVACYEYCARAAQAVADAAKDAIEGFGTLFSDDGGDDDVSDIAEQIAAGHAREKHYPGETVSDLAEKVGEIMRNPTARKLGRDGRTAYWDHESGTIVIRDPNHPDQGTVFEPDEGRKYLEEWD